jgi:alpha-tubulin suppressor-like RCC1 family protein
LARFVSISAGDDHLLALTSTGRTFGHPITSNANSFGQLGFRKVEITQGTQQRTVELNPKSVLDPYAQRTSSIRPAASSTPSSETSSKTDVLAFCDHLFEIPALKDIKITQIATGGRSSYVLTSSGRVLGWGANEYGYVVHRSC